MNNRIIQFLKLTQDDFALKLGITKSAVSAIETHKCDITKSNKILICQTFHVNRDWLETGNGDMFVDFNPTLEEFSALFDKLNTRFQSFLLDTAKRLIDIQDDLF